MDEYTKLNLGKIPAWSFLASFLQPSVRHSLAELLFWPLNEPRGASTLSSSSPFLCLAGVTFVPGLWKCIFSATVGGRKFQAKFGAVLLAAILISSHWETIHENGDSFLGSTAKHCTPSSGNRCPGYFSKLPPLGIQCRRVFYIRWAQALNLGVKHLSCSKLMWGAFGNSTQFAVNSWPS